MSAKTLADLKLSWNQLVKVSAPSKSANPVLRLEFSNGAIYWLKAAPGGARIAFAEMTMNRIGFKSVGSQLLKPSEVDGLANTGKASAGNVAPLVAEMRKRLAEGQDLIFSSHVGGNGTYESKVYGDFDDEKGTREQFKALGHNHATLMQSATAQRDLARMAAADMILGNFDRVAKGGWNSGEAHFHLGNFIYDATTTGFLPIDNDTLAPSVEHMPKVSYKADDGKMKKRAPTRLDLYRTAILGGVLLENKDLYATERQIDLSAMLGDKAEDQIFEVITGIWGQKKLLDPEDEKLLRKAAVAMVPMVREEMRNLVKELKTSTATGGQEGLQKTLKAYENVEGMDYSVFKVRSRFAQLMTLADTPPSTQATAQHALSYGIYRDWKDDFARLVARPVPNYPVPNVLVAKLTTEDKAKRGLNTVLGKVGIVDVDANEEAAKKIAKGIKTAVRDKNQRADYEALKAKYDQNLRDKLDTDNRIIKAKLLVIGVLVNAELTQLRTMLHEMTTAHKQEKVVATLYAKAFMKQDAKLQAVLNAYDTIVAGLKRQLTRPEKVLGSTDMAIIGVGGGNTALETLCAECRTKYGLLKAMATS